MTNKFRKFKLKALAVWLIRALSIGLCFGLVGAGTFLTLSRFEVIKLDAQKANQIGFLAIGLGLTLLIAGIILLASIRGDKKIARKLDQDYQLDERVQTMLAYEKKHGTMYELQRLDTDKTLGDVNFSGYVFKKVWVALLCLVICAGLFGASFAFKPKPVVIDEPPPPPEEELEPFELSENQMSGILTLIAQLEASEMSSPYKENISTALQTMLEELVLATTMVERDASLEKAITYILDQTDSSSVGYELITTLWETGTVSAKQLAKAINFYDWAKDEDKAFNDYIELIDAFKNVFKYTGTDEEKPSDEELLESLKGTLALASTKIKSALEIALVDENDAYYKVFMYLIEADELNPDGTRVLGFDAIVAQADTLGYKNTQRELDNLIEKVKGDIHRACEQNKTNIDMGELVITRVASLFSYPIPKFERPQLFDAIVDDGTGEEGTGGAMGGIGSGTTYGSDDLVYDPITNAYVEYGVIVDRYRELMYGATEGGQYTEEEINAIRKYFDILYGGFDTETEE